jgi:hypothetical protein
MANLLAAEIKAKKGQYRFLSEKELHPVKGGDIEPKERDEKTGGHDRYVLLCRLI